MLEPGAYVCDLRALMRARLLCGLYSRRSVAPRWRSLARAYCLALTAAVAFILCSNLSTIITNFLGSVTYLPALALIFVSQVVSLWTEDEYIHTFFTQNRKTDFTLDSPLVFNQLQKQLRRAIICNLVYLLFFGVLLFWTNFSLSGMLMRVVIETLVWILLEFVVLCSYASKLLVMSLLNARLLVLKRRLQRYGFRAVGRASPQPYVQIYDEIMQMLDATGNPFRVLLFSDLIFGCMRFMSNFVAAAYLFHWNLFSTGAFIMCTVVLVTQTLMFTFGHVVLLESAAAHCHHMELFTVTQLIKTPTGPERKRMREFLRALEHRGARYYVLRALPLDARLVLRALGFCTAQAFVSAITILTN